MRSFLIVSGVALVIAAVAVGGWLLVRGSPAKVAFAGEADELCAQYHDRVGALDPTAGLAAYAARSAALAANLEAQLRPMTPPAAEREDWTRFLAIVEQQLGYLRAERRAALRGDTAEFHRLARASKKAHARQTRLAKQLGFLVCGR